MYKVRDSKVIPEPSLLISRLHSRLGYEKTAQCPELAWPSVDGVLYRSHWSAWVQMLWGSPQETTPVIPPPGRPSRAPHSTPGEDCIPVLPVSPASNSLFDNLVRNFTFSCWLEVLSTKLWRRIPLPLIRRIGVSTHFICIIRIAIDCKKYKIQPQYLQNQACTFSSHKKKPGECGPLLCRDHRALCSTFPYHLLYLCSMLTHHLMATKWLLQRHPSYLYSSRDEKEWHLIIWHKRSLWLQQY